MGDEPSVSVYDEGKNLVTTAMTDDEWQISASIEVDTGLGKGQYHLDWVDSLDDT